MAVGLSSSPRPQHYLYAMTQSVGNDLESLSDCLCIFPQYDGQTIGDFILENDRAVLKDSYSELIETFKTWITINFDNPESLIKNIDLYFGKVYGEGANTSDYFLSYAHGGIRKNLMVILQLLNNSKISLDIRKKACDDIAFRMAECTQGIHAELQICRINLETALLGKPGLIQRLRFERAQQTAKEFIKPKNCKIEWEDHVINALTNYVADDFGLPKIEDKETSDNEVAYVINNSDLNNFKALLKYHLSPAEILHCLTDYCVQAYQQALACCRMYPGESYSLRQLATGAVNAQIKMTTKHIEPLLKGFDFSFNDVIFEKDNSDLYTVSLSRLRNKLSLHLSTNLNDQSTVTTHQEPSWKISRQFSNNRTFYKKLYFFNDTLFYIKGYDDTQAAVTVADLVFLNLSDIDNELLFSLFHQAIVNTVDFKTLCDFYFNELRKPKFDKIKSMLMPLIFQKLADSEFLTSTTDTIRSNRSLTAPHLEFPLLFLPEVVRPLKVTVALMERNYQLCPTPKVRNEFCDCKFIQYASATFLCKIFSESELIKLAKEAVKQDHSEALMVLLKTQKISNMQETKYTLIHSSPTKLTFNLLHFCIVNNANNCLRVMIPEFSNELEETCHLDWTYTPLHLAIIFNKPIAVGMLLDAGAKINAKSRYGYTPMHWAIYYNHEEIVRQLMNNVRKPNLTITDEKHQTARQLSKTNLKIQQIINEHDPELI